MRKPVLGAFGLWVQQVIDERYGGVAGKLAKAIGVALTTLTRGQELGTMGVDTLLRLALVSGRNPSEVLRLAGKGTEADLIEECFGPAREESPYVRAFRAFEATLPEDLVRSEAEGLTKFRDAWLARLAGGTDPAGAPPVTERTRAKRASRGR